MPDRRRKSRHEGMMDASNLPRCKGGWGAHIVLRTYTFMLSAQGIPGLAFWVRAQKGQIGGGPYQRSPRGAHTCTLVGTHLGTHSPPQTRYPAPSKPPVGWRGEGCCISDVNPFPAPSVLLNGRFTRILRYTYICRKRTPRPRHLHTPDAKIRLHLACTAESPASFINMFDEPVYTMHPPDIMTNDVSSKPDASQSGQTKPDHQHAQCHWNSFSPQNSQYCTNCNIIQIQDGRTSMMHTVSNLTLPIHVLVTHVWR